MNHKLLMLDDEVQARQRRRAKRFWVRPWLSADRRLQFGHYDQLLAPHHVFGILFLKQSEMLVPCQLLNNLSNHVFVFFYLFKIDAFNHIMLQFSWVFRALPDTHHGIQLFEKENAVWILVSATFLLLNRVSKYTGASSVWRRYTRVLCRS